MPETKQRSHYYSHKRQLTGNDKRPQPAWRHNNTRKHAPEAGSKILLSNIPNDVEEHEIIELFNKTVGPVKESFLIYNSQGKRKGMAVVSFQRPGDAAVSREKYDGVVIDNRRPLSIEIVTRSTGILPANKPPATLIDRIAAKEPEPKPQPPVKAAPVVAAPKRRVKKGPKRLKKQVARVSKTLAELDQDMDEYRSAADAK